MMIFLWGNDARVENREKKHRNRPRARMENPRGAACLHGDFTREIAQAIRSFSRIPGPRTATR
jgi:hypothetical protein